MPLTVSRRQAVALTTLVLVGLSGTSCSAGSVSTGPGGTDAPSRDRVQGPPLIPATVPLPDGRALTCPGGAEPTVYVQRAAFEPLLTGGTQLVPGTYSITLQGRVVNETNSPILLSGLRLSVGKARWKPRVEVPAQLAANSSRAFVAKGSFRATRKEQARVSADLGWRWQDATLKPCGTKGLIEDD